MKIAIDCRMLGKSGIGTYLEGILPYLINNEKFSKNEFILFGDNTKLKKYITSNVDTMECDIKPFSIKDFFCFPNLLKEKINKCDIYYTPYCNIPNGIKIPIYSTIHDVVFLDISGLASKIGVIIRKLIYKYACYRSELIFTVSEFSKKRIEENLRTKKNIVVTYNGISEKFTSNIPEIKKENIILFVGNIKKHKGLQILIPAFLSILKKFDFKLYIVGSSKNLRTKDRNFNKLLFNIPKGKIIFTEEISSNELVSLYRKSKILVQPSLYEGFGIPPLEALYSKTNVILSNIEVFKEIYNDFPVTFFQSESIEDLAQKIENEIINPKNIDNFPKKYSYEETAKKIINIWNNY